MSILTTIKSLFDIYHIDFETSTYVLSYSTIQEVRSSFYQGLVSHTVAYYFISSPLLRLGTNISLLVWHLSKIKERAERPNKTWWLFNLFKPGSKPYIPLPGFRPAVQKILIASTSTIANQIPLFISWCVGSPRSSRWLKVMGGIAAAAVLIDLFEWAEAIPTNLLCANVARAVLGRVRGRLAKERGVASLSFVPSEDRFDQYTYSPLESGGYIRLLKMELDPAGRLIFDLVPVSLEDLPPYEALSYRWGSSEVERFLTINGKHLAITCSVFNVLLALSAFTGTRYIWIDSICIDQNNIAEKNHQLPLMGHIYSRANRVLAYIEPPSEEEAVATSHFIHLLVLQQFWYDFSFIRKDHSYLPFQRDWNKWKRIKRLARNEYWSRVWMVQEFALGENLAILYGNVAISWPCMLLVDSIHNWKAFAADYIDEKHTKPVRVELEEFDAMTNNRVVMRRHLVDKNEQLPALPDMVTAFRSLAATQPKDKVYGFLGLYEDAVTTALQPDYRKSPTEVFTDLMEFALATGSLTIFSCAGLSHERSEPDLPSWIADLGKPARTPMDRFYIRGYHAGGSSPPDYRVTEDKHLRIRGCIVDRIKICTDSGPDLEALDSKHQYVKTIGWAMDKARLAHYFISLASILMHSHVQDPYPPTQQPLGEAFWRTLIQDHDEESFPARNEIVYEVSQILTAQQEAVLAETDPQDSVKLYSSMPSSSSAGRQARSVASAFPYVSLTQLFAVSAKGYMALVPPGTLPDDVVCVLEGFPVPLVLRPREETGEFDLWGDAYVHGLMSGEALKREEASWIVIR